jgi:hypothetical protein
MLIALKLKPMKPIEKNSKILENQIIKKFGFATTHKRTALELLAKYSESDIKTLSRIIFGNGLINSTLIFKNQNK